MAITASCFGPLITGLYCLGLLLGTVYSVPPLRLKKSAVAAFMIIATVSFTTVAARCDNFAVARVLVCTP